MGSIIIIYVRRRNQLIQHCIATSSAAKQLTRSTAAYSLVIVVGRRRTLWFYEITCPRKTSRPRRLRNDEFWHTTVFVDVIAFIYQHDAPRYIVVKSRLDRFCFSVDLHTATTPRSPRRCTGTEQNIPNVKRFTNPAMTRTIPARVSVDTVITITILTRGFRITVQPNRLLYSKAH